MTKKADIVLKEIEKQTGKKFLPIIKLLCAEEEKIHAEFNKEAQA